MEYSLPSCTSTYENPCPTFDPKDDKDGKNPDEKGQKIFQKAKSAMIEFNECDNPRLCQCNVETELVKNKAVVAGEQTILSLGELVFTNTGTEPSIKNSLDIIFDSTKYHFVDLDSWRCNYHRNSHSKVSCSLPTTYGSRTIPLELELKSGYFFSPLIDSFNSITMGLHFSTICNGQQDFHDTSLTVPVEYHWTMKAVQSPDQSDNIYSWSSKEEHNDEDIIAQLTYELYNIGPSMTQQSKIFVYVPSSENSKGLLRNVKVTYQNVPCTVEDNESTESLPHSDAIKEKDTKVFYKTKPSGVKDTNLRIP